MNIVEHWFYMVSNRRSHNTVAEYLFEWQAPELVYASDQKLALYAKVNSVLSDAGLPGHKLVAPDTASLSDPRQLICHLYCHIALLLQQSAGHLVTEFGYIAQDNSHRARAIFEYEEISTAIEAAAITEQIFRQELPELPIPADEDDAHIPLADRLRQFLTNARAKAQPADTRALQRAAKRAAINCLKLEREPFLLADDSYLIRRNTVLRLGQGQYQRTVDSNFCVDRCSSYLPLVKDQHQVFTFLRSQGLPVPDVTRVASITRALRIARRTGYPLTLQHVQRKPVSETTTVDDEKQLRAEMTQAGDRDMLLRPPVPGNRYLLLIADRQLLKAFLLRPGQVATALADNALHTDIITAGLTIAGNLDVGLLTITLAAEDPGAPLSSPATRFLDLDIAPQLDTLLGDDSPYLDCAADAFLQWLYPIGSPSTVPSIAVTGTNGKTTTCRMIHRILRGAGRRPGLACTDGIYDGDNRCLDEGDLSGGSGHLMIMNLPELESAIYETARGGVVRMGIAYEYSDIGVCLNVSRDHLGDAGIDTLPQMTDIKRTVVAKARKAVVLNADSPPCLTMLPFPDVLHTCLVSTRESRDGLRHQHPAAEFFAVIEQQVDTPYLVLYDRTERILLIPVADIPATFSGSAAHNVSNALHAALACYMLGIGPDEIQRGLAGFEMSFDNTPGRLNIYDQLPFRVVMDYAHNAEGYDQLSHFVNAQTVTGRKIVMFAGVGDRNDDDIMAAAAIMAGKFDRYICRNYKGLRGNRNAEDVPRLMKTGLMQAGVPQQHIHTVTDADEAVRYSLELARPGDLLALLPGSNEFESVWQAIIHYPEEVDDTHV